MRHKLLDRVENIVANGEIAHNATMFSKFVCYRGSRKRLYVGKDLNNVPKVESAHDYDF